MSLLEDFRRLHPELAPTEKFPTERGLEVYMETVLREEIFRAEGLPFRLSREGDGLYRARVGRGEATGFSGWKALLKAYLRHRGLV